MIPKDSGEKHQRYSIRSQNGNSQNIIPLTWVHPPSRLRTLTNSRTKTNPERQITMIPEVLRGYKVMPELLLAGNLNKCDQVKVTTEGARAIARKNFA